MRIRLLGFAVLSLLLVQAIHAGDTTEEGEDDDASTKVSAATAKSKPDTEESSESPDKITGTTEIYKFIVDVIRRPIDPNNPSAGYSVVEGIPQQISETAGKTSQIPTLTVDQVGQVGDQVSAVNPIPVPQSVKDRQQNLQNLANDNLPPVAGGNGNPVQVPNLPSSPTLPEGIPQPPEPRIITITDNKPHLPSPVSINLGGNSDSPPAIPSPPSVPQGIPQTVPQVTQNIPQPPPVPQVPQNIPQTISQVPQNIPQPAGQVPQNLLPAEVQQPLSQNIPQTPPVNVPQVPQSIPQPPVNVPQVPQNIPQPVAPQLPQPPQPPQGVGPITSLTSQVTRPLDQISPPATPPQQIPDDLLTLVPNGANNIASVPNQVNQYIPPEVNEYNPANGNSPYSPVAAGKAIVGQAEEYVPSEYQNVPNDIRNDIRNPPPIQTPISSPYIQPQPSAVSPSYPYNKGSPTQTMNQQQTISYGGTSKAGGSPAGGQPAPAGLNFGKYVQSPAGTVPGAGPSYG